MVSSICGNLLGQVKENFLFVLVNPQEGCQISWAVLVFALTRLRIPFFLLLRVESFRLPGRYLSHITPTLLTFLNWSITYGRETVLLYSLIDLEASCLILLTIAAPSSSKLQQMASVLALVHSSRDTITNLIWSSYTEITKGENSVYCDQITLPNHHPQFDMKLKDVKTESSWSLVMLSWVYRYTFPL